MIDLHCHILPGIDDGPSTLDESLEMARLYAEAGFTKVVATPHFIGGSSWMPSAGAVVEAVARLNAAVDKEGIALEVLSGMEIAMDFDVADLLSKKTVLPLAGGPYVLIEAPFQQMPLFWDQVFFQLASRGRRVLLAHPERCGQLAARPEMAADIAAAGVYFQVNYDSFLGAYGSQAKKTAFFLLAHGRVHCLATDSHDPVHRRPRPVEKALSAVAGAAGAEAAELLSRINPARVLSGEVLESPSTPEAAPKKKRRWGIF